MQTPPRWSLHANPSEKGVVYKALRRGACMGLCANPFEKGLAWGLLPGIARNNQILTEKSCLPTITPWRHYRGGDQV